MARQAGDIFGQTCSFWPPGLFNLALLDRFGFHILEINTGQQWS
jgi:hypothetical protein